MLRFTESVKTPRLLDKRCAAAQTVPLVRAHVHQIFSGKIKLARHVAKVTADSRVPHLFTFSSCAVRVCQAALDDGLRLDGAQFTTSGEALTPARRAAIEATGAKVAAGSVRAVCNRQSPTTCICMKISMR